MSQSLTDSAPRRAFAVYAITAHGAEIGQRLVRALPDAELWASRRVRSLCPESTRDLPLPIGPWLRENFHRYDAHIFVISVGAVVRLVAPCLVSKKVDPAVICVDDAARFSISTLSGHVGRGNQFAQRVADILGATPVVTTASDVRGTLSVDILGRDLGWCLDDLDRNVTASCAAVVNASPVAFIQECGEPNFWPLDQELPAGLSYFSSADSVVVERFESLLVVSDRDFAALYPEHYARAVVYRPKTLVLGLGCDRATPFGLVERGVQRLLERNRLSPKSVAAIASIDIKRGEPALVELCEKYGWAFLDYSAADLEGAIGVENPSAVVYKYVGTHSVAEAACLLGAGAVRLTVPKTSYTEPGAERNMTFAVARKLHSKRENNGS